MRRPTPIPTSAIPKSPKQALAGMSHEEAGVFTLLAAHQAMGDDLKDCPETLCATLNMDVDEWGAMRTCLIAKGKVAVIDDCLRINDGGHLFMDRSGAKGGAR